MKDQQKGMIAFATLTKVDEAKRLVFGRAVQEVPDKTKEIFDYASSKPLFQKWSASQSEASMGKSHGNIRAMHKDVAAGIIPPDQLTFNDDERAIDICAHITDDQEWNKVLTGTYTGFSIGGSYAKKWEDGGVTRYTGNPSEISLVDRPCVGTATFFEIQKADGSVLRKDFQTPQGKDESDADYAKRLKAMADKKSKDVQAGDEAEGGTAKTDEKDGMATKVLRSDGADLGFTLAKGECPAVGKEFQHDDKTYSVAKVEGNVATVDEVYDVIGTPAELGAFAKALADRGMGISDATALVVKIAATEVKPQDARERALELYKDAGGEGEPDAPKLAQFMVEAEKLIKAEGAALLSKAIAARSDATPAEGKKKYGAVKFADPVNKKYPIDTADHVRAALSYIGMAKNSGKYSAEDLASVKGRIDAAAKEMGIDIAKVLVIGDDTASLIKGLRECGQLAYLIDGLCSLADSVEAEAAAEGDGSELCARLYNCIDDLGGVLQEMVGEEVSEEVSGSDDAKKTHLDQAASMLAMSEALGNMRKRLDGLRGITPELVELEAARIAKAAGKEDMLAKGHAGREEMLSEALAVLRKAGARHSKADLGRVQAVHDHAVGLGASCGGMAEKTEKAKGLLKAAGIDAPTDAQIAAAIAKLPAEALAKGAPVDEALRKDLSDTKAQLGDALGRLAKLEAQPLPVRGFIKMVAVGKEDEHKESMSAAEQLAADVEPVRKQDGSVDEVATAMKMVLKKGGVTLIQGQGRPLAKG